MILYIISLVHDARSMNRINERRIKMSKKNPKKHKKKKQGNISILNEIDNNLNHTYKDIVEEIEMIQLELNIADAEALKKERKKMKKDNQYNYSSERRVAVRKEAINKIEATNLLGKIESVFRDISPIIVIIARLIASLILAVLSLDPIKNIIKPDTLRSMNRVYQAAMAIS